MPDPNQTQNSDTLDPEDAQALIHAQQQLYAAGDPRATKLYNYIINQGIGARDTQGNLYLKGDSRASENSVQRGVDSLTKLEPFNARPGVVGHAVTALGNVGAGLMSPLAAVAHPENTAESLINTVAQGADEIHQVAAGNMFGATTPGRKVFNDVPSVPEAIAQTAKQNPAGLVESTLGGLATGEALNQTMRGAGAAGTAIASRASGALDTAKTMGANHLPSFVDGPPESLMTRAIKPGKNNVGWNSDVRRAVPLVKSAEQQLGHPIQGIDDAVDAAQIAKKSLWQQINARLQAGGQMGATIDGNQIADAMMSSVDKRMATQNPQLASQIKTVADTYRRPIPVDEAEDFLQSNNRELTSYYAKNKVSRNAAQADPQIAYKVAEGDALRDALYTKLDQIGGPGAAQLKKAYGSLMNMEKELTGRQIVYARQAPVNLAEQLSYMKAGGKILTGNVLGGMKDIAIQRFLSEVNDTNSMISRAFAKASPATPFPMPVSPRLAGLIERGPIQMPGPAESSNPLSQPPPIDATTRAQRLGLLLPDKTGGPIELPYVPEMSGDERLAALMHYLRNSKPPKGLPAKASVIQLSPPR